MLDCVVIGAGPAGITAGIYCACYRMSFVLVGKLPGGEMTKATRIINYPGFPPVSGNDLTQKMVQQLHDLGGQIHAASVAAIEKTSSGFRVRTDTNDVFDTKTTIVATGTERRKLNIPGENGLMGKGVFYCATCDASYYDGKIVAVVGGSNAAVQAALQLAERSKKVCIIYRGEQLRADQVWIEQVGVNNKIEVIYNTTISHINGTDWVNSVRLDTPHNGSQQLDLEGVFIEIGGIPGTSFLLPLGIAVDDKGFIEINTRMETNVSGIYAAGDCTTTGNMLQQISVSVGEGAKAAGFVYKATRSIRPPALWGKMWTKL